MNPFQTTSDEGVCLLAAKHFRRQAKQLAKQFDGIRAAEDIECIHRARVASRRLRAGLQMFQTHLQPEVYQRWRKHIRRITSGLGDARDKDVQIEFLCRVFCELHEAPLFPGVARLLADLEKQRERLQPKAVKSVGRIERSGVLDEMVSALREVRSRSDSDKGAPPSAAVFCEAEQRINAQIDEMLSHEDGLSDPLAIAEHHAMRIAVKRLRYTIEIAKPAYGECLGELLKVTKRVQSLLGDIHDCDVWEGLLAAFARWWRERIVKRFGHEGPYARLALGIEHLQGARARDRRRLFGELAGYWKELQQWGVWEELRRRARAPGAAPAVPARADDSPTRPNGCDGPEKQNNGRSLETSLTACAQNRED